MGVSSVAILLTGCVFLTTVSLAFIIRRQAPTHVTERAIAHRFDDAADACRVEVVS